MVYNYITVPNIFGIIFGHYLWALFGHLIICGIIFGHSEHRDITYKGFKFPIVIHLKNSSKEI